MIRNRRNQQTNGPDSDRRRRGAALAEYGLLLAGLTLASMVAVSVLGGKVGGMIASVATILPGTTASDNATVQVGQLIQVETTDTNGDGALEQVISSSALHNNSTSPNSGMARVLGVSPAEASHLVQLGDRQQHQQLSQ